MYQIWIHFPTCQENECREENIIKTIETKCYSDVSVLKTKALKPKY
jgi:hypothetical protein